MQRERVQKHGGSSNFNYLGFVHLHIYWPRKEFVAAVKINDIVISSPINIWEVKILVYRICKGNVKLLLCEQLK